MTMAMTKNNDNFKVFEKVSKHAKDLFSNPDWSGILFPASLAGKR
jgi:hypothetical protein